MPRSYGINFSGVLFVLVATKVAVDKYLEGSCELRNQDEALPWGAQQVPAYPSDGITVFLAGVGGLSRALVDGVRQLGSGSFFEVIHLADDAPLVEASVELW